MKPISTVQKIIDSVSETIGQPELGPELKLRLQTALQSILDDMNVVTREEFDAQTKVLQHTRARLEQLEQDLAQLSIQIKGEQHHQ